VKEPKATTRPRAGKKELPANFVEKKVIKLPNYHFYEDRERLLELLNKENDYKYEMAVKKANPNTENGTENICAPLTDKENREKEELISTGFSEWSKNDFNGFIKGCEKFGRKAYKEIAELIEDKTEKDVREYASAFWKRGPEDLGTEWDRIIKNIEKGEETRRELQESQRLLASCCQHANHFDDIKILPESYSKYRSKVFLEEHDRFILYYAGKNGGIDSVQIVQEIRKEDSFKMDYFIRSRTEVDISKRLQLLLKYLRAEEEEIIATDKQLKKAIEKETKKLSKESPLAKLEPKAATKSKLPTNLVKRKPTKRSVGSRSTSKSTTRKTINIKSKKLSSKRSVSKTGKSRKTSVSRSKSKTGAKRSASFLNSSNGTPRVRNSSKSSDRKVKTKDNSRSKSKASRIVSRAIKKPSKPSSKSKNRKGS
jgi:SWI/SNF-related matrix-associated actin-dependent regulator of chromatin subfamily A member 5